MKPNPPIDGHHLLFEGGIHLVRIDPYIIGRQEPKYAGGCQCGAQPGLFPHVSKKAMQRWHRGHKADLRGEVKYQEPTYAKTYSYVWCDLHGGIHRAVTDVYEEGESACKDLNWRAVYIETTDPNETFD